MNNKSKLTVNETSLISDWEVTNHAGGEITVNGEFVTNTLKLLNGSKTNGNGTIWYRCGKFQKETGATVSGNVRIRPYGGSVQHFEVKNSFVTIVNQARK